MRTPVPEMVRIFVQDRGSSIPELRASAAYARKLSTGFSFNPWAEPHSAADYDETAKRLDALADEKGQHQAARALLAKAEGVL